MPEHMVMLEPSGRGGIAQYTWCLTRALSRMGVDLVLLTALDYEWRDHPPVRTVKRVFRGIRTSPFHLLKQVWRLNRKGYRIWHFQSGPRPGSLAALIPFLRLFGARTVLVTAHDAVPHNAGRIGRWAARGLYLQADVVFVHGPILHKQIAELMGRHCPPVVEVPFGGMEELPIPDAFPGSRDEILFFGYINSAKGLDLLIRAVGILRRQGFPGKLRIAGKLEEPWARYAELLKDEGLLDSEIQLGYLPSDQIAGLFSKAAVIVLPYREASQSGLLHLAARFRVPVVATRVGGLPNQVKHKISGLLVEPEDENALANAIQEILVDPSLADRLAEGAFDFFHGPSSMEAAAKKIRNVYAHLGRQETSKSPSRTSQDSSYRLPESPDLPLVSVIAAVRNESKDIETCLDSIAAQDYPGRMEVLVADGRSDDDTRRRVVDRSSDPTPVRLLDNPNRITPCGLNVAIAEARGAIVARVDGHMRLAPDYLREAVLLLQRSGAAGVGGPMRAEGKGMVGRTIAAATSSPFGVGNSRFHYAEKETEAETVYLGVYPTKLIREIGGYDEELKINEDDELNARIRAAGGQLLLSPRLRTSYTCRDSWLGLWKQYSQYGCWKNRSLYKTPEGFRLRHLIPALFVVGLVAGPVLSLISPLITVAYLAALVCYVLLAAVASIKLLPKVRIKREAFLIPFAFFVLHTSYGLGMLVGLVRFRGGRRADPSVYAIGRSK